MLVTLNVKKRSILLSIDVILMMYNRSSLFYYQEDKNIKIA